MVGEVWRGAERCGNEESEVGGCRKDKTNDVNDGKQSEKVDRSGKRPKDTSGTRQEPPG